MSKKNPFNVKMTEREREIMSLGKSVICPACRETCYLYPKGVGFHPYMWEMNCNLCHLSNLGVNAYIREHQELYIKLIELRDRYIKGETSKELAQEIEELANVYDNELDNRLCECGGYLSIAALPKCIYCDVEISDSYFRYSDDAPRGTPNIRRKNE